MINIPNVPNASKFLRWMHERGAAFPKKAAKKKVFVTCTKCSGGKQIMYLRSDIEMEFVSKDVIESSNES
ncbi:unnamed protein product [Peronospora farinosa]|uniref:Uncharacterized protein n=1 Tax=Peronospora farinosa TaxID=134698 RepID=A0AAV0U9Q8_9STRA|nr:unnamed protein product [Peronospora farinosa]CAI5731931.1 unnamed protein product [Peronospora farinosa]